MTPEELTSVEIDCENATGCDARLRPLCAALRTAWAERDFAAKVADDAVAELTARTSPEVVAKVREALRQICGEGYGRDDTNYDATVAREALRLLEKP